MLHYTTLHYTVGCDTADIQRLGNTWYVKHSREGSGLCTALFVLEFFIECYRKVQPISKGKLLRLLLFCERLA